MVRLRTTISTVERVSSESVCHDLCLSEPEIPTWEPLARYFPTVSARFFQAMQENQWVLSCFSPFWPVQYSFTAIPEIGYGYTGLVVADFRVSAKAADAGQQLPVV
jgi:hypothetical protein